MATQAAISVEEYLRSSYEHDREYVHGEVVERGMPTNSHSKAQVRFVQVFLPFERSHQLFVRIELRSRVQPDLVRIPDVSVYSPEPLEEVPTAPPLIAIEIFSPGDRTAKLLVKCREYQSWGVKHIWAVDPEDREFMLYKNGLIEVPEFSIPEFNLTITPAHIFE